MIRYFIVEGPGTIDSLTGAWTYSIDSLDIGTFDTLIIGASAECPSLYSSSTTILDFAADIPADLNDDCISDISDLVLLVGYMFSNGTPPTPLHSADMDGNRLINISDLVWLVAYMFNTGPPPVG